jgi:hypothetical protein
MTTAVVASSLRSSLIRYSRSRGLWLLLLVAPVGARFMVAERGATHSLVAVHQQVPWLTSQVLGMVIGVVIATLLLPVAYIYLRANLNKHQPWQVEEPTAASRVSIAYGRWLADIVVLAGVLAATTAAGIVLAYVLLPARDVNPFLITAVLWVIAAPPVAMIASLRILLDARPWLRGWVGDVLFFIFWIATITFAAVGADSGVQGYAGNMLDLPGFMSPVAYTQADTLTGKGNSDFSIGGNEIKAGSKPIVLDVVGGVVAPGYLPARLTWLALASLVPLLAGAVYAPHVAGRTRRRARWLKLLDPGKAKPADPRTAPARSARAPWAGLVLAEGRLIASGRPMMLVMGLVALASTGIPTALGGPTAMLPLLFAVTAHAGRTEQAGLLALTGTGVLPPWARRVAFVAAGTLLGLFMTLGSVAKGLAGGDLQPLLAATIMGAGTSAAAIGLGALTRSPTVPRLILLIVWYGYLNAAGGR